MVKGVPTPVGGGSKRRKGEANTKTTDEESVVKLLTKSVGLLLAEQRTTASRIGITLLLPGDHPLTQALEALKQCYGENQPVKEAGKAGTPHPWGAPRHVFVALMFEVTISEYND